MPTFCCQTESSRLPEPGAWYLYWCMRTIRPSALDETSQPIDLLLSVSRAAPQTLRAQIEDQLRCAIRDGALKPGTRVPSTRDLARQLGVSRRVAVDAYEQLAAEGYLLLRQGARPAISDCAALPTTCVAQPLPPAPRPRFDFRLGVPDVSKFPRAAWLRSLRTVLASATNADLGYGDSGGTEQLRVVLAEYLGRVRGVVADPSRVVVTSGYWQGLGLVCRALAASGARRIAFEDPSHPETRLIAARAGLEPVPVAVDDGGMRIDELERTRADAVALTPAHQFPTGAVLSSERRTALLAWLREHDAIALEDDYDADYRYDRAAVGALQGLDPDRIVQGGSTSKTLAPALRMGWLVVPPALLEAVRLEKNLADQGTARIEQLAFAHFVAQGELDRHLRRMRVEYRRRRDALVTALRDELPQATVRGIAAGLHATVGLPLDYDEQAILDEARRRGIGLVGLSWFRVDPRSGPPGLVISYAQSPEPAIRSGIKALAEAVRAAGSQSRY
jgi:GntR family transcriptional regulator/MocR family aminotransferase